MGTLSPAICDSPRPGSIAISAGRDHPTRDLLARRWMPAVADALVQVPVEGGRPILCKTLAAPGSRACQGTRPVVFSSDALLSRRPVRAMTGPTDRVGAPDEPTDG